MKQTFLVLCASFAIGSVGLGAQYGGQSTSSKDTEHKSKSSREVTLTGCLEQGSSPDVFVLRNASESEGGASSQMSGSSQGTSGSSQGMGTSGSSSTSGSSAQGMSGTQGEQSAMDFQLVGKSKDLKKYVGQRVEVRGKVEPMRENQSGMSNQGSTSGGTTGETGGTSGTSGTTGSETGGSQTGGSQSGGSMSGGSMSGQSTTAGAVTHRVKVSSVKQLSSSCQ